MSIHSSAQKALVIVFILIIFIITIAFAGVTIPFGMAKSVADSDRDWQNQGGFIYDDSRIRGISQLHDEGTGGASSLGNFPIWMHKCAELTGRLAPRLGTREWREEWV